MRVCTKTLFAMFGLILLGHGWEAAAPKSFAIFGTGMMVWASMFAMRLIFLPHIPWR